MSYDGVAVVGWIKSRRDGSTINKMIRKLFFALRAMVDPMLVAQGQPLAAFVVMPRLIHRLVLVHGTLPVSAALILLRGHEPHALSLPPPHLILSNAEDLLSQPQQGRSPTECTLERFEGFRMTC